MSEKRVPTVKVGIFLFLADKLFLPGLFAALLLAEAGARPMVIERGLATPERVKKVEAFTKFGILDPECNIQFGEGGAGTFSDGKLKVGGMDKYKYKVLSDFVNAGAPEDILYKSKPHIGTDILMQVIQNMRNQILEWGGEIHFHHKFIDFECTSKSANSFLCVNDRSSIVQFNCYTAYQHQW